MLTLVSPFSNGAAIAPAGSNPAVILVEMKFEAMRRAIYESTAFIASDLRSDRNARQYEEGI